MSGWVSEAGFWFVAMMLTVTAIQAIGAIWAKQDFLRVGALAVSVAEDPGWTPEDRMTFAAVLAPLTAWYTPAVLLVAVPVLSIALAFRVIYFALIGREVSLKSITGISEALATNEISKLVRGTLFKANPILALWFGLWVVPALLIMLIAHVPMSLTRAIVRKLPLALLAKVGGRA
jgi:hypothetical protein